MHNHPSPAPLFLSTVITRTLTTYLLIMRLYSINFCSTCTLCCKQVFLKCTHAKALEYVTMETLKKHAVEDKEDLK